MIKLIRINLIPYREYARQEKKVQFKNMLAVAVGTAVLLTVTLFFLLDHVIARQNERNSLLSAKNEEVGRQLEHLETLQKEKQILLLQKQNLDSLRFRRFTLAKMLNDLDQFVPRGVQLTKIESMGENHYFLYGRSVNDNRVAILLKVLGTSGLFRDKPVMNVIQSKNGLQEFKITAELAEDFSYIQNQKWEKAP